MARLFQLIDTPYHPNLYLIKLEYEGLPFKAPITGSYNVFASRLLGLTYAQYLRFCRDVLGAELYGKNCLYVLPLFKKTPEVQQFVRLLNAALARALQENEHPYDIINGEKIYGPNND